MFFNQSINISVGLQPKHQRINRSVYPFHLLCMATKDSPSRNLSLYIYIKTKAWQNTAVALSRIKRSSIVPSPSLLHLCFKLSVRNSFSVMLRFDRVCLLSVPCFLFPVCCTQEHQTYAHICKCGITAVQNAMLRLLMLFIVHAGMCGALCTGFFRSADMASSFSRHICKGDKEQKMMVFVTYSALDAVDIQTRVLAVAYSAHHAATLSHFVFCLLCFILLESSAVT